MLPQNVVIAFNQNKGFIDLKALGKTKWNKLTVGVVVFTLGLP